MLQPQVAFLHRSPQLLEQVGSGVGSLQYLVVHSPVTHVRAPSEPQATGALLQPSREVRRGLAQGGRVAGVAAGHDLQHRCSVGHIAGDGARLRSEVRRGAIGVANGRHPPLGWLDPVNATQTGGNAYGASAVGADGHGRQARSHGRGRAATGAAGRAPCVPRIATGFSQLIRGSTRRAELRGVGLAQNHCARGPDPRHWHRVAVGHMVFKHQRSHGCAYTLGHLQVFNRYGYAQQWPTFAPDDGLFGTAGGLHRVVTGHCEEGI